MNSKKGSTSFDLSDTLMCIGEKIRPHRILFIAFGLVVLTFCAFNTILENEFIGLDDPDYITQNPQVQKGLTISSVKWAFSDVQSANWHPLTWLSHMLDVEMYDLRPSGHHLTSLLIHVCNVLLLFGFFCYLTGTVWRSALIAALFAIHPLRVESVAWVAERKDVLSSMFGLLSLWAYAVYVRKGGIWRYLCIVITLLLGLMSKAMLVTWPLLMLLLDIWPLKRWKGLSCGQTGTVSGYELLREKMPLMALSGLFCIVAFIAQKMGNAVVPLQTISISMRLINMFSAYGLYLGKIFYPSSLAVYYPYQMPVITIAIFFIMVMILLCTVSILQVRSRPYWTAGWFWFMFSLLPVIGFVQIGSQAMADRYTYLPSIGILWIVVWGIGEIAEQGKLWRRGLIIGASVCLVVLLFLTWGQTFYWKDSLTLFKRTLDITKINWVIEQNYGIACLKADLIDEAEIHLLRSRQINPGNINSDAVLGELYLKKKQFAKAESYLSNVINKDVPHIEELYCQMGIACGGQGKYAEAEYYLQKALTLRPEYLSALYSLAEVCRDTKKIPQSVQLWKKILSIDPTQTEAMIYLAWILATSSDSSVADSAAALQYGLDAARQTNYTSVGALDSLAAAYARCGDFDNAVKTIQEAIQIAENKSLSGLVADMKKRMQCYADKKPWLGGS